MKMKKTLNIVTLGLVLSGTAFTSCKYEEGPGISLRSKKNRVEGTWKLDQIIKKNDDGKIETTAVSSNTTYQYNEDYSYIVTTYTVFLGNTITTSSNGKWAFNDDKSKLLIAPTANSIYDENEIIRLTNSEMWLRETDSDGSYTEYHYKAQ